MASFSTLVKLGLPSRNIRKEKKRIAGIDTTDNWNIFP